MVSGKSWTLVWTSGKYEDFAFRINLEETYEIELNKSIVTIRSMEFKANEAFSEIHYPNGQILIGGQTALVMNSNMGTHNVRAKQADVWYTIKQSGGAVATGSVEIEHDNDGSKTVLVELADGDNGSRFGFATPSGNGSWTLSNPEVQSITLTHIPRASTIGATDADIGAIASVIVMQRSPMYTHSIRYLFKNLSGYINSDGSVSPSEVVFSATNIAFLVPETFYAELPDAPYDSCTLVCTTYYNGVQIGDAQSTTFKATANKAISAPIVVGTVVDVNEKTVALTGDPSVLIQYCSDALCTIQATAKNAATIKTKKINAVEVTEDTKVIPGVETKSISFSATDSRGYSTTTVVEKTLIGYVKLTVNAQLNRTDPTSGNAVLTIKGNYFNDTFGAIDNSLRVWYRVGIGGGTYGNWIQVSPTLNGNSYGLIVNLNGLDYLYPYTVQVMCEDKISSKTVVTTVSRGIPVFDWGEKDFRFNVPFLIPDSSQGLELPSTGKKGQVFFLRNSDGSYSIRIYDGTSW